MSATAELDELIDRLPFGWTRVSYRGAAWAVSRSDAVGGRAITVYAEELGGPGVVSANLYRTGSAGQASALLLKPCEMPKDEVLDFLRSWSSASKISSAPGGGSPGSQHDAASSGHAP